MVDNWGLCSSCLQLTCCQCNKLKEDHKVVDNVRQCPRSENEELLKLVKERKWKTCPKCQNIVSRNGGCNTMRCRCGQGFCYTCGKAFKGVKTTCGCPMTFEGGVPEAEQAEVWEMRRPEIHEWPEQEAMFDCDHVNMVPRARRRCHGCLRGGQGVRVCVRCFTALCSACRAVNT